VGGTVVLTTDADLAEFVLTARAMEVKAFVAAGEIASAGRRRSARA
jgi:hypothetical protein